MRRLQVLMVGTLTVFALLPSFAAAASSSVNAFFNTDGAASPLGPKLETQPQEKIQYLPPQQEKKKPQEKKSEAQPLALMPQAKQPQGKKPITNKEELLAQFGDPASDPLIPAQKEAPAPFKAMLQALQLGDDDLAFQYAKQYIRYRERQKQMVQKLMAFQGLGMEAEDLIDEEGWTSAPEVEQFRDVLERDRAVVQAKKKAENPVVDQGPEVRQAEQDSDNVLWNRASKLVLRAENEAERQGGKEEEKPAENSDADELQRMQARRLLTGKVHRDPEGKVEVYFFFKPAQALSKEMAVEVEKLYRFGKNRKGFNLAGLSVDSSGEIAIQEFKASTKATFPVLQGAGLVQKLGVKSVPTIVLRAPSTNKFYYEQGLKKAYYLQEEIKMIQGDR